MRNPQKTSTSKTAYKKRPVSGASFVKANSQISAC